MNLAEVELSLLIEQSWRERRSAGAGPAPASVELFRRAFGGEQEAWGAVEQLFRSLMLAWVGTQPLVEAEDVLQEALLAFARFAPRHPSLLAGEALGPVLEYLRKSTKTALLALLRRERGATTGGNGVTAVREEALLDLASGEDVSAHAELRLVLRERIGALLEDEEERLIFSLYFACELSPREILERHPERFTSVLAINTIVQRLTRRLRKDDIVRQLAKIEQEP